jgi:hypothetical protein
MSYNGTVRCGWCGQTGHNRRGCPEFKKHVAKAAAEGDRWAVDQLERKKRPSTRRCSWCGNKGHNKKTCTMRREAEAAIPLVAESLNKLCEKIIEGNLTRGAIVKMNHDRTTFRNTGTVLDVYRKLRVSKSWNIADVHYIAEDPQHMRHVSRVIVNGMIMKILTPKDGKTQVYIPQVEMSLKNDTSPLLIGSQSWKAVQQTNAAMSVRSEIEVEPGTTVIGMTKFAQICDEAVKLIK